MGRFPTEFEALQTRWLDTFFELTSESYSFFKTDYQFSKDAFVILSASEEVTSAARTFISSNPKLLWDLNVWAKKPIDGTEYYVITVRGDILTPGKVSLHSSSSRHQFVHPFWSIDSGKQDLLLKGYCIVPLNTQYQQQFTDQSSDICKTWNEAYEDFFSTGSEIIPPLCYKILNEVTKILGMLCNLAGCFLILIAFNLDYNFTGCSINASWNGEICLWNCPAVKAENQNEYVWSDDEEVYMYFCVGSNPVPKLAVLEGSHKCMPEFSPSFSSYIFPENIIEFKSGYILCVDKSVTRKQFYGNRAFIGIGTKRVNSKCKRSLRINSADYNTFLRRLKVVEQKCDEILVVSAAISEAEQASEAGKSIIMTSEETVASVVRSYDMYPKVPEIDIEYIEFGENTLELWHILKSITETPEKKDEQQKQDFIDHFNSFDAMLLDSATSNHDETCPWLENLLHEEVKKIRKNISLQKCNTYWAFNNRAYLTWQIKLLLLLHVYRNPREFIVVNEDDREKYTAWLKTFFELSIGKPAFQSYAKRVFELSGK